MRKHGFRAGAVVTGRVEDARLLDQLREFLDEQRHAAGSVVDLLDDGFRRRGPCYAPDELTHLAPREAVQGQCRLVRDRRPRGLKLGPEREEGQNTVVLAFGEKSSQKLESGRVDPVQILDDEQNGPTLGIGPQPFA